MKRYVIFLMNLKMWLLLLLLGSCGLVAKHCLNTLEKEEMKEEIVKQIRIKDNSLSEMSVEEFQEIAQKYFGNARIRVIPFFFFDKENDGIIMQKENTLYYVQSLSGRGQELVDGTTNDFRLGTIIAGEQYFLSDPAYYLLVNDFVCDALYFVDVNKVAGAVSENKVYCVGWKAEIY